MRKRCFSEAQTIGMIKEKEAQMPTADVCRKHGLSQGALYKFKSQSGGMEVSDAAKFRPISGRPRRRACPGARIGLMAAQGKEDFYRHFGYESRLTHRLGAGMTMFLTA